MYLYHCISYCKLFVDTIEGSIAAIHMKFLYAYMYIMMLVSVTVGLMVVTVGILH